MRVTLLQSLSYRLFKVYFKSAKNSVSQALTKAQSTTTSSTSIDTRNFGTNYANPSYETSWTSAWPTSNHTMPLQPEINTHQIHRPYKSYTPPQTYKNQQHLNQTLFNFNQSVFKCFRCQTELTHSTQCLHQQTTDALNNIAISYPLQENLHFINNIPIFKAKDLQSFQ